MTSQRYVVIMAGGGGTRLWPHSRRSHPKQFLPILPPHGDSLLAATVRRTMPIFPLAATFVVTTAEQVTEVRRCLPELPLDNIIVEPTGRNTAPCIGLAVSMIARRAGAGAGRPGRPRARDVASDSSTSSSVGTCHPSGHT